MSRERSMPVAIIGMGNVGTALASRLTGAGFEVRFAVREPGTSAAAPASTRVMAVAEASAGCSMTLLAVPAAAAVAAARSAGLGPEAILVDCTNPLRWDEGPVWDPPAEGSVAQAVAAALPGVHVVKGFNHFGAEVQHDPIAASGRVDALFAADDAEAKTRVMDMATAMGFRSRDAGPLRNAPLLENLAVLWIHLATVGGLGRRFSFRLEC